MQSNTLILNGDLDLSSITTGTAVGLEMTERTTKKAEWIH
jgi:hypothetical protein